MSRTSWIILALVLTAGSPATAQEDASQQLQLERARESQEQGDVLYRSADFEGALQKYRESYRLAPRPLRLLGMAQCYRHLRQWDSALAHYKAYLEAWTRHSPGTPPRYLEEVREHIARLQPLAARPASQPSRPAARPDQAPVPPEPARPRTREDGVRRRKSTLAWIGIGAALACTATAGVLYGVGLRQRSDAYDRYMAAQDGDDFEQRWGDVDSAQAKITGGHVMVGLAAGALAFTLYELLTRPKVSRGEGRARIVPGPLSVAVQASF